MMEQNGNGHVFTITRSTSNNAVAPQDAGSSDNLVKIRTRSAMLKKKSDHDRKCTIGLLVLCVLLAIAVVAMACSYFLIRDDVKLLRKRLCETEQCIRSAANLRLSMDPTVDPCDDFYQFTCGRWTAEHPDHGWFSMYSSFALIEEKITLATLKYFQSNATKEEPFAVKQSRDMYKACMDTETMNEIGYAPIFKYLSLVGLPQIPTFLNMTEYVDTKKYKYDWLRTEIELVKYFAMPLFVGLSVEPNVFNTSENCIVLGVPDLESPLPSPVRQNSKKFRSKFSRFAVLNREETKTRNDTEETDDTTTECSEETSEEQSDEEYAEFVKFVMKTVIKSNLTETPDDFQDKIDLAADLIVKFTNEINTIHSNFTNASDYYIPLTVNEMQNATNKVFKSLKMPEKDIWRTFLTAIFNDTNVTLHLDDFDKIYVDPLNVKYLFMITGFISALPDILVELWVWWMTVNALIINTTNEIREFLYKQATTSHSTLIRTRSVSCAVLVNEFMGMAVSYALADRTFFNETKPKIEAMLGDIKTAFAYQVGSITWMDEKTKRSSLEKINETMSFIGYPDWLYKEGEIDKYYTGLVVQNDTHLENMMSMVRLYVTTLLESLRAKNGRDWHSDPTTVNAYNFFLDNSITVPMAILFFPLYNLGLEVLNYGAIGSILGHELTHGFDNTGRKYDKYGNYRQWWTNSTIDKFENLTKCFVNQYNSFYLPEIKDYIDGNLTLGENIADNGGLNNAFLAYRNFKKRHGEEPMLPGFETITQDQMFFIAYGSVWCDKVTADILKYQVQDVHCPNKIRVLGTLINSEDFIDAFKCPVGSRMNPDKKRCKIW